MKRGGYLRARALELSRPTTRLHADPLALWAVRKIRLDGRPFSFVGHEYLRAIYDDTAPHLVLSKAAQIGGTSWAILRAIHSCILGLNVMYFFPTRTDVLDFGRSRVNPLLQDNPFLRKLMTDTDTVGLKRIGDAHLYLRGMQSSVGMKSVPADLVVFDELDESEPQAKAMARERLGHSDYKRIIELSNPSLPDYGIDEAYQKSDQRHWTIRCDACGTWAALDKEFPAKLGQEVRILRVLPDGRVIRACPNCESELDVAAGEWVADFPSRPIHGYRISQLFSSKIDPAEILGEYRTTRYPDRFYNLKIGVAWADLERRLDAASVLSLCTDEPFAEGAGKDSVWHSMGVDTGRALHVVIQRTESFGNNPERIVYIGECHEFSELDRLMKQFDVGTCVIDGLPETHATREFAKRHDRKVHLCFFQEGQRGEPKWDSPAHQVVVNRTEALDASRRAIREKLVLLPRRQPLVETFAQHLTCDAKVLDEDEDTGIKRYRYIKTGVNHFSLAFTYSWLASQMNSSWRSWMSYLQWMKERDGGLWIG
jgi:hypothetical protein